MVAKLWPKWSPFYLVLALLMFWASPVYSAGVAVADGKKVTIQFTLTTEDGTIYHKSGPEDPPFTFVVGGNGLIPGLQKALMGLKEGQEKKITLQPKDAFGPHNPKMVAQVPRGNLPPKPDPEPGMHLRVTAPDGSSHPAVITAVSKENVTLDMNHPLAGKVVVFNVKVVKVA